MVLKTQKHLKHTNMWSELSANQFKHFSLIKNPAENAGFLQNQIKIYYYF